MKILLTGIDGFLGRAIAETLKADGHHVVGVSNGRAVPGFEFHKVDITDPQATSDVFEKNRPELCIHLAALAHADVGPDAEWRVRRVNVDGALSVADAAEQHGCADFVYFSSAKVLAETTSEDGIDEVVSPQPMGVYARLKREVELDLLDRNAAGRLNVAIIRPVAVIGPGDAKGNYAKLIRAIGRGVFPMLDGGRARRSIVFLDRVALRVAVMVQQGINKGRIYAFSDGDFELRAIVDAIRSATGFAWCPEIPTRTLSVAAPHVDKILARFGRSNAPVQNTLKRLTDSFVIKTHRFDADYGPLPALNLNAAMRQVCS